MVPIAEEENIEVLRSFATTLVGEVTALRKEVTWLRNRIDDEKQATFPSLIDQLSRLRVQYFGAGRETISETGTGPVGHPKQ